MSAEPIGGCFEDGSGDFEAIAAECKRLGIFIAPYNRKLEWLRKELEQRTAIYDRRVEEGRMQKPERDYQLAILSAILDDYERMGFSASPAEWKAELERSAIRRHHQLGLGV